MQDYDALSKWHFEAEVGEMRGIVALGEKGGIAALRVKFAEGDTEVRQANWCECSRVQVPAGRKG